VPGELLVGKLASPSIKDVRIVNREEFKLQNIVDLAIQTQLIDEDRCRIINKKKREKTATP